jgi:hypothetical protein
MLLLFLSQARRMTIPLPAGRSSLLTHPKIARFEGLFTWHGSTIRIESENKLHAQVGERGFSFTITLSEPQGRRPLVFKRGGSSYFSFFLNCWW